MLDGVFSQSGGRKDLERLEYAVDQLLDHGLVDIPEEMSDATYEDFVQWGSAFMRMD
jgi:hypothetical protein